MSRQVEYSSRLLPVAVVHMVGEDIPGTNEVDDIFRKHLSISYAGNYRSWVGSRGSLHDRI